MSDDVRSQLQTMARWADAQHEPIDPDRALGRPPSDGEPPERRLELSSSVPPAAPRSDRRRWVVLAAAVLALVVGTSVVVTRRDGVSVEIPSAGEPSPNGWTKGPSSPPGSGDNLSLNGNVVLTWTGTEVLAANSDPILEPMPPTVLMGEDGPVGTVPGLASSSHGRFGPSLAYDPALRTWRSLPDPGLDLTDDGVPAVWTGHEYIVAGRPELAGCVGRAGDTPPTTLVCMPAGATAAALDPATGTWRRLADPPEYEIQQTEGIWTGDTAVFVGQTSITTYVPATDTWRVLATIDPAAPIDPARPNFNAAAWDGRELILVDAKMLEMRGFQPRAFGMDIVTGALRPLPLPPSHRPT